MIHFRIKRLLCWEKKKVRQEGASERGWGLKSTQTAYIILRKWRGWRRGYSCKVTEWVKWWDIVERLFKAPLEALYFSITVFHAMAGLQKEDVTRCRSQTPSHGNQLIISIMRKDHRYLTREPVKAISYLAFPKQTIRMDWIYLLPVQ